MFITYANLNEFLLLYPDPSNSTRAELNEREAPETLSVTA